ncbi:GNAT family N-acetyltransferase [Streptomyces sp. NPDC049627]|uniref:GNAT family N-acetyltransferase n=1 Tax=Streptomyces sp. NPDC049627 TaxID=3365595 RepID=UPI0037A11568
MIKVNHLSVGLVDSLRPLWRELVEHHARVSPHLDRFGDLHPEATFWEFRRRQYLEWMDEGFSRCLTAHVDGELAAYAMVRIRTASGSRDWGDRVGVLETLVVREQYRGMGLGGQLYEQAMKLLADEDVATVQIAVMAGNDGAMRFYQQRGAVPFLTTVVAPTEHHSGPTHGKQDGTRAG